MVKAGEGLANGSLKAQKRANNGKIGEDTIKKTYRAFHKLPQIYTANHATFPIQMYAITV